MARWKLIVESGEEKRVSVRRRGWGMAKPTWP